MATQTRGEAAERGGAKPPARRNRTTPALFFRQVVAELHKVIWPTRRELVTYTTVAMVFIIIMIAIVTSLDYGFRLTGQLAVSADPAGRAEASSVAGCSGWHRRPGAWKRGRSREEA